MMSSAFSFSPFFTLSWGVMWLSVRQLQEQVRGGSVSLSSNEEGKEDEEEDDGQTRR